jgi:hypothetical protein
MNTHGTRGKSRPIAAELPLLHFICSASTRAHLTFFSLKFPFRNPNRNPNLFSHCTTEPLVSIRSRITIRSGWTSENCEMRPLYSVADLGSRQPFLIQASFRGDSRAGQEGWRAGAVSAIHSPCFRSKGRFEIRHPDYLWIVPGGRWIGIADDSGSVELIDLVHVTSLKTNGSAE